MTIHTRRLEQIEQATADRKPSLPILVGGRAPGGERPWEAIKESRARPKPRTVGLLTSVRSRITCPLLRGTPSSVRLRTSAEGHEMTRIYLSTTSYGR